MRRAFALAWSLAVACVPLCAQSEDVESAWCFTSVAAKARTFPSGDEFLV